MRWPSSKRCDHRRRSSPSARRTGMVIPLPRRSRRSAGSRHIAPTATARWSSIKVAASSSLAPTRMVFLLHGEDSFRMRLRLGELVGALLAGRSTAPTNPAALLEPRIGTLLGVSRHDARTDSGAAITLSGQAQGLFAAIDERRVVVVEHADALRDLDVIASFPPEAALVLVAVERLPASRARRAPRTKTAPPTTLTDAVEAAGGVIERIDRLAPADVPPWISARAKLHGITLAADAMPALASAVGPDAERIEQELGKLAAYAGGAAVTAADVRILVSGAIEADVFELTQAVVRKDAKIAIGTLERLPADGDAGQQIPAPLLWPVPLL